MKTRYWIAVVWFCSLIYLGSGISFAWFAQNPSNEEISALIQALKRDERGPYAAIRWFCPDGEILPAQSRCPKPGGIQHAVHKEAIQELAQNHGIYLGQILAGTPYADFLDEPNLNSRMKQYQLEKYLQLVDDGWILRRARYYRGAIQAEDEEAWGQGFLKWLVSNDSLLASRFFLVRQAVKDIPHLIDGDNKLNAIRAGATTISESLPAFANLRVKLHGKPDAGDVARVKDFYRSHEQQLAPEAGAKLQSLIQDLEEFYRPAAIQALDRYYGKLSPDSDVMTALKAVVRKYGKADRPVETHAAVHKEVGADMADLLLNIRMTLPDIKSPAVRLGMLDLSLELEQILFRRMGAWQPETLGDLLNKAHILSKAAAGCGFLEVWEWQTAARTLPVPTADRMTFAAFQQGANNYRRIVEWSSGMVRATYVPTASLYLNFEALASGFVDDQIRSSVLLPLGNVAADLIGIAARKGGAASQFMGLVNQGEVRGLNPGFTVGELEVVTGSPEKIAFSDRKIYALMRAPADIKPVAGILTVSEGNLVSHVQLLARNLGIPSAVLSLGNLQDLAPFSDQKVFYAVSPKGTVVMKPAAQMTSEETALFEVEIRSEKKVVVSTKRIDLKRTDLIPLSLVRSADSGRICGPKAANLGQLKSLFPDKVGEGIVIPFGVFRRHMDQDMPGTGLTYWGFLKETFAEASRRSAAGESLEALEKLVLERLALLQEAIHTMNLLPDFVETLQNRFSEVLGTPMGKLAVFIRSDTNMEDLKQFTGAGLNLTVFNVTDTDKIWQGIRDVWASPYAERSYRWRQKFLLNPENVFPSILILPTINVDKSGVMVTTGVYSGDPEDITVAFCRGPGGAVEGQAAESWVLQPQGNEVLLAPARDEQYNILPKTGGLQKGHASFHQPVLTTNDLEELRALAAEIKKRLPRAPGIESRGPFDLELGFKDNSIWLFQARPYVENKRARSSTYLLGLDSKPAGAAQVQMNTRP